LFATNSPAGSPGAELFYEHVHFTPEGNYLLARAWAEMVANYLPASITNGATAAWAGVERCQQRLAFTDWNRFGVLDDLLGRLAQAPFTGQLNHSSQVQSVRASIQQLRGRTTPEASEKARAVYQQAIARAPKDFRLQESYAEFLELRGDLAGAAACWEAVRELIPYHHVAYVHAGRLDLRLSRLPEAETRLKEALAIRADIAEAWLLLGQTYALQGRIEESLQAFDQERQLAPGDHRVYYHLGKIYSKQNRRAEAIAMFRQSLRLRPAYWEAKYALAEELAFDGKTAEARVLFEEALVLNPDSAPTHLNLGVALVKEKQLERALHHFEEVLRLSPGNQQAADYAAQVRKALNK
jgi:tetratricopeptide (TPR) repeat protein